MEEPSRGVDLWHFGADDEKGRINLLTAEKVPQGVAEVQTGETFSLSHCVVSRVIS